MAIELESYNRGFNEKLFTQNPCIYSIVNRITGKKYIGSAVNLKGRIDKHRLDLKRNNHHSPHLQHSYNKYGIENFYITILEETNKENLLKREQYWMDNFEVINSNKGYNIAKLAGSRLGMKNSPEHRAKISKALTGKKLSPETLEKLKKIDRSFMTGENHFRVKPIYQYSLKKELLKIWNCGAVAIGKELSINRKSISECLVGRNKTGYNFIWSYKKLN
jgi:group I intron endonuclease